MFKISDEQRKTILKYLSSRPYAEVFQLVAMIVGLKPSENSKEKEDEKKITNGKQNLSEMSRQWFF